MAKSESAARQGAIDPAYENAGGAWLRDAAPRHTSGRNMKSRLHSWRETAASAGGTRANPAVETKSNMKAGRTSGRISGTFAAAGQRERSETQNEPSCPWRGSGSCDGPVAAAGRWQQFEGE